MWVFDAAMDANPVGLTVLAVAALVAGIVLLILHFKEVVSFLRGPWGTALILLVLPFVAFPLLVALHFKKAMSVFSEMIGWIKSVWSKLGSILSHPFEYLWGKVSWVFKQIKKAIGDIANVPSSVLKSITGGVNSLNIPGMPSLAAGGTMSHGGFAMINENQQGEVVYLPGGSSVQPSPASSMLQPRAHTPNPAPVEGTTPVQIEAYLELPRSAGRGLYKLITQSVAVKTARS
jgi:phage-related protein